jgi:hypothetical protein
VRAVPRLCGFKPGICLTAEEKARKNLSQGSESEFHSFGDETYEVTGSDSCHAVKTFPVHQSALNDRLTVAFLRMMY